MTLFPTFCRLVFWVLLYILECLSSRRSCMVRSLCGLVDVALRTASSQICDSIILRHKLPGTNTLASNSQSPVTTMDWLTLIVPFAYLGVLIGCLATFSSLYRRRKAGTQQPSGSQRNTQPPPAPNANRTKFKEGEKKKKKILTRNKLNSQSSFPRTMVPSSPPTRHLQQPPPSRPAATG